MGTERADRGPRHEIIGEAVLFKSLQVHASELRIAIRSLFRTPVFTAVVVATLALGIGGTTAVFTLVSTVLLEPLPYDEPGELVRLYRMDYEQVGDIGYASATHFIAARDRLAAFEDVAASYTYREEGADITRGGSASRIRTLDITSRYFAVLRAQPVLGREFTAEEEQTGQRIAILSHPLWQDLFSGSRNVLGRTIELSGVAHTVVGVAPAGFEDPVVGQVDVFLPIDIASRADQPSNRFLTIFGRLRNGTTLDQARAETAALETALVDEWGETGTEPLLVSLHEDVVAGADRTLYVLLAAVGLVLLIVCVNVANLMLSRGAAREREFAIRAALGSGRAPIIRQLLAESLLLAGSGGIIGAVFGLVLLRVVVSLGAGSIPRLEDAAYDGRVLAFTAMVSLGCAIVFGLLPAARTAAHAMAGSMRDGSRSVTGGARRARLRATLVGAQVALAFMLLVGAGLLTLSFYRLKTNNLGIDTENVATFEVHLPAARYDDAQRAAFHEDFSRRLAALPRVTTAGATSRLPATGTYHSWGTVARTGPRAGEEEWSPAEQRVVAGDYFEATGIELMEGRLFDARDHADAPGTVVISARLAETVFPDTEPLGQLLRTAGGRDSLIVIGVVEDVALDVDGNVNATMYHAHTQFASNRNWALTYVAKIDGDPGAMTATLRRELAAADSQLVLHRFAPLDAVLGQGTAQRRFTMMLMTGFAAVALVLAALGLFGVIAYGVRQRRRELGIRLVLGARPDLIRTMVVKQGLRIAAAGIVIGLLGALALGRVLASLVYDTKTTDPLVLGAAALTMVVVGMLASYLPARHATMLEPRSVLEDE